MKKVLLAVALILVVVTVMIIAMPTDSQAFGRMRGGGQGSYGCGGYYGGYYGCSPCGWGGYGSGGYGSGGYGWGGYASGGYGWGRASTYYGGMSGGIGPIYAGFGWY